MVKKSVYLRYDYREAGSCEAGDVWVTLVARVCARRILSSNYQVSYIIFVTFKAVYTRVKLTEQQKGVLSSVAATAVSRDAPGFGRAGLER